jgi:hypothetical protein
VVSTNPFNIGKSDAFQVHMGRNGRCTVRAWIDPMDGRFKIATHTYRRCKWLINFQMRMVRGYVESDRQSRSSLTGEKDESRICVGRINRFNLEYSHSRAVCGQKRKKNNLLALEWSPNHMGHVVSQVVGKRAGNFVHQGSCTRVSSRTPSISTARTRQV